MSDKKEEVSNIIQAAEEFKPPEAPVSAGAGGDAPPPPDDGDKTDSFPRPDDPHWEYCQMQKQNDVGNGRRFLRRFGKSCIYVPGIGWHFWTNKYWCSEEAETKIRTWAHKTADLIHLEHKFPSEWHYNNLNEVGLKAWQTTRKRFANGCGNTGRINNMTIEARAYITKLVDHLDFEPLAVNTRSGTLRFSVETDEDGGKVADFKIDKHKSDDLITNIIDIDFKKGKAPPTPLFDKFFERVMPDSTLRLFLQRYAGYCMTALTHEQVFVFNHGRGANGKSVLVDTISRILNTYACTLPFEALAGDDSRKGGDATPDLARLPGKRLVRASEPKKGVKLKEDVIKQLTSGEPILVRKLREDFIEIAPTFKLMISGNHKPTIFGTDHGIWRRVLLVPWSEIIPEKEKDINLADKLWDQEREGILHWMVDGLLMYLEEGLNPPEAVRAATEEYKSESDPLGVFIRDCVEITRENKDNLTSNQLFTTWSKWRETRPVPEWKHAFFGKQMKEKGLELGFDYKRSNGSRFYGIKLRPEEDWQSEDDVATAGDSAAAEFDGH